MAHAQRVNPKIAEVTNRNIESILCYEDTTRVHQPISYRIIAKLTEACGTVSFLIGNAVVFAAWVLVNQFVVPFDPYPYTFLLFGVSIEAIFLAIMILISQNMSAGESEKRHHLDLQMNLLTERETTAMLRLLLKIAEKNGVDEEDQREVRQFAHDTDPAAVLTQIVRAEHRHAGNGGTPGKAD